MNHKENWDELKIWIEATNKELESLEKSSSMIDERNHFHDKRKGLMMVLEHMQFAEKHNL